jgi:hypothetical protein
MGEEQFRAQVNSTSALLDGARSATGADTTPHQINPICRDRKMTIPASRF